MAAQDLITALCLADGRCTIGTWLVFLLQIFKRLVFVEPSLEYLVFWRRGDGGWGGVGRGGRWGVGVGCSYKYLI